MVVLDGGRSAVVGTRFSPALHCIRCGACLNVCPVYRQVGGHTYDSVYSGPIGAVLTPLLKPTEAAARELAEASSLCGACTEICPVRIPLHDLLLHLRHRDARADASPLRRAGFWLWSQAWSRRWIFRAMVLAARAGLPVLRRIRRLPNVGLAGSLAARAGTAVSAGTPRDEFLGRLGAGAPGDVTPAPRRRSRGRDSCANAAVRTDSWRRGGRWAARPNECPPTACGGAVAAYAANFDGPLVAAARESTSPPISVGPSAGPRRPRVPPSAWCGRWRPPHRPGRSS